MRWELEDVCCPGFGGGRLTILEAVGVRSMDLALLFSLND